MHITITEQDYQELVKIKREYEQAKKEADKILRESFRWVILSNIPVARVKAKLEPLWKIFFGDQPGGITKMDDQVDEKVIAPENYVLACIDCATHMIWDKRLVIKRDEYERLKRLDENVKKANKYIASYPSDYNWSRKAVIELLESLDK